MSVILKLNDGKWGIFSKNKMKKEIKIGIVVSKFNIEITSRMLARCREELLAQGVSEKNLFITWVPGAYELPFAAFKMAKAKKVQAIICLGCVLKGDTTHDEHVANWSSFGTGIVSLLTEIPCLFGVITPKNISQAMKRAGSGSLNRGKEMARAALEMISLRSVSGS
jgi:6,7-dimethyl-8-ribityllumazine synthase